MMQQAVLTAWTAADRAVVTEGACVAEVAVEGRRHRITAPASGRLFREAALEDVLEPGDAIGRIEPV